MKQLQILIAEDESVTQRIIQRTLEKLGYHADVAGDGTEVMAALEKKSYDIIFMDLQMPVMDGFETTMKIRQEYTSDNTHPVILALTSNSGKGFRQVCTDIGMQGFLSKPVDSAEIQESISKWFPG